MTVLQRAEHLTDRRSAESVRTGMDWQYLLGLPFDDLGFDHTVLAGESVRAALEALAAAHPGWLEQRICVADFARRYGTPMTSWHSPASQARRDELAVTYARDGYALLEAVCDRSSPAWLHEIPAVDVLRRVLLQNYTRIITEDGLRVPRTYATSGDIHESRPRRGHASGCGSGPGR